MNELAKLVMPYALAAVQEYGGAVLNQSQDDAPKATIGLGRRLLQRIFGTREPGEPLPKPLADAVAYGEDDDAVAALRLAVRNSLAVDSQLRADVDGMLASASVSVRVSVGEVNAGKTITGIVISGDVITGNKYSGDNAPRGLGGDRSGD